MYKSSSGTYEAERSEAAEETGTEDGCEGLFIAPVVVVLFVWDTAEQQKEHNAFKLARKFWYIAR